MDMGISSVERQMNTYEKHKLLMVPGECFEMPGFIRIGYGNDAEIEMFRAGLAIFSAYLMKQ